MFQRIAIAVGAGLASALLFVVPVKATPLAFALAFLASLPIMLAGLGFGALIGASAALAGTLIIGLAFTPILGIFFAVTLGLPAFWLARLATMSRPATSSGGERVGLEFYPQGRLLAWMATLAAVTALSLVVVMALRAGALSTTIDEVAERLAPAVARLFGGEASLPAGYTARDFARVIVLSMPALMAGWGVVTFSANLWLAGRIAQISGLLPKMQTDIPYRLRLPRECLWVLAASLAACMLGEVPRLAGTVFAAAFGVAYALHGLAAIHGALRGTAARMPVLLGLYFLMFVLLPWPLIVTAGVGIFDAIFPLRRRPEAAPPAASP